tara:strand:- start:72 stop:482 length:411 start_codon:yes stop_codon:yes gene_type:complete
MSKNSKKNSVREWESKSDGKEEHGSRQHVPVELLVCFPDSIVIAREGMEGGHRYPSVTQLLCSAVEEPTHVRSHHWHTEQTKVVNCDNADCEILVRWRGASEEKANGRMEGEESGEECGILSLIKDTYILNRSAKI